MKFWFGSLSARNFVFSSIVSIGHIPEKLFTALGLGNLLDFSGLLIKLSSPSLNIISASSRLGSGDPSFCKYGILTELCAVTGEDDDVFEGTGLNVVPVVWLGGGPFGRGGFLNLTG